MEIWKYEISGVWTLSIINWSHLGHSQGRWFLRYSVLTVSGADQEIIMEFEKRACVAKKELGHSLRVVHVCGSHTTLLALPSSCIH